MSQIPDGSALTVDEANRSNFNRTGYAKLLVAGGVVYAVDSQNNVIPLNAAVSNNITSGSPSITITGLTEDTAPDLGADYIRTYDATAAADRKVLLGRAASPVLMASQTSTSGTTVTFSGVPSWAKKITISFDGVSLSDNDAIAVQLGISSGVVTVGYASTSVYLEDGGGAAAATNTNNSTTGFIILSNAAGDAFTGHMILTRINTTRWISSHTGNKGTAETVWGGGSVTLSADLTSIHITDSSGGGSFDAGLIGVMYE